MLSGQRRMLIACVAILMAFFLYACDESVPANTPQPHDTPILALPSPSPTFASAYANCDPGLGAGKPGQVWTDCWDGVINGYQVFVKAGYDQSIVAQGCGEEGIYEIDAWAPNSEHLAYLRQEGGGCGRNHILGISGGVITFNMDTVDLESALSTTTPTP